MISKVVQYSANGRIFTVAGGSVRLLAFTSPQQMVDMTEAAILAKSNSKATSVVTAIELCMINNKGGGGGICLMMKR